MSQALKKARTPAPYASDLDYLEAEMEWVESRCNRIGVETRLAALLRGETGYSPFRSDEDETEDELENKLLRLRNTEALWRDGIDARRAKNADIGQPVALDRLCETYCLSDFERTIVLLAAAPCFSRRFEDLYGKVLPDGLHSGSPSVEVIFAFCELGFAGRIRSRTIFSGKAPLLANDLVSLDLRDRYTNPEDLLTASVTINALTFNFLLGEDALGDEFLEFSSLENPIADFEQVVLNPSDKERILSVVQRHDQYLEYRAAWGFDARIRYGRGILMLFYGPPGTGKTMTAHAVAETLGKRVLNVDIPTFLDHREADRFLPGLFREARLRNAVLFFDECETLFGDRRGGNALMTLLLTELERFEGVAILATNLPETLDGALERRILVKVRFPEPDRDARAEIWSKHLPPEAPLADDVDIGALASRYEMSGGYIKNAVLTAVAAAVHTGGDAPRITQAHLDSASREQLKRPSDKETDLVFPSVCLDHMVLPASLRAQVDELLESARHRRTVLERWGIGKHLTYGRGVSALLSGPPGTGKTLCAEAIAGELGRPLLRGSIPSLVSMFVGQTERNIDIMFRAARANGAVLFLDEADTLLMARGEGRASRHDDSVVNVLLQLIERHPGVVLLATNLPDRLDTALERRLTYKLRFPFPGPAERTRIWRKLLPDTVPIDDSVDLEELGRRFELSGGQIKNAVFKAAFRAASAAGPVRQALLSAAAREELNGSFVEGDKVGF